MKNLYVLIGGLIGISLSGYLYKKYSSIYKESKELEKQCEEQMKIFKNSIH